MVFSHLFVIIWIAAAPSGLRKNEEPPSPLPQRPYDVGNRQEYNFSRIFLKTVYKQLIHLAKPLMQTEQPALFGNFEEKKAPRGTRGLTQAPSCCWLRLAHLPLGMAPGHHRPGRAAQAPRLPWWPLVPLTEGGVGGQPLP